MSNLNKAMSIILGRPADKAAHSLEEAGLLMPDLPEPIRWNSREKPTWETEGRTKVRALGRLPVSISLPFREDWDMYPSEARDIAYALLAAADYAELNLK